MPTDADAVEADLRDVIAPMGDMDPSGAEAHAIGAGAVAMLRILPPGEARDDYGHALVARAPSLAAEV